jgi:hypothetical protein
MATWDDADLAYEGPEAWQAYEELRGAPPEPSQWPVAPDEPPFVYPPADDFGAIDDVWEHRMLDDLKWSWGSLEDILDRVWEACTPERQQDIAALDEHTLGVTLRGLGLVGFAVDYGKGYISCGESRWLRQPRGGFHRVL